MASSPVSVRLAASSAAFGAREPGAVAASCGISVLRRAPAEDFVPAPGAQDAPEDAPDARAVPLPAAADYRVPIDHYPAAHSDSLSMAANFGSPAFPASQPAGSAGSNCFHPAE